MKRTKTKLHSIIYLALGGLVALATVLCVPQFSQAQSYVEPEGTAGPGTPPFGVPDRTAGYGNDSPIEFLNGADAEQRKIGSLIVGEKNGTRVANCTASDQSGCSRLCLNPAPANGIFDPMCVRTWAEAATFAGGPFLRLLTSAQIASQTDPGTVTLQGRGRYGEYVSVIGEANPAVAGSYGLRARSDSTNSLAGFFSGKFVIRKQSGGVPVPVPLCLNGTCITAWSDIQNAPADAVKLQTAINLTADTGHIAVTDILQGNSVVSGVPLVGTPTTLTCGDGICSSENGETNACIDCQ